MVTCTYGEKLIQEATGISRGRTQSPKRMVCVLQRHCN